VRTLAESSPGRSCPGGFPDDIPVIKDPGSTREKKCQKNLASECVESSTERNANKTASAGQFPISVIRQLTGNPVLIQQMYQRISLPTSVGIRSITNPLIPNTTEITPNILVRTKPQAMHSIPSGVIISAPIMIIHTQARSR
jgi:hypothetical protein